MKKWIPGVVLLAIISCISFSCNNQKSLQELLQEERKAIDRFINTNELVILGDYLKNGVFKENEYFRTTDGLFFQVVDSGNGLRAKLSDDISVRFDYCQYIKDLVRGDSTQLPPYYWDYSSYYVFNPYSFVYGISQTYQSPSYCQCPAWVIPLDYVGEDAVLNLIVPSSLGSAVDNQSILPMFYKNLHYTRFN